MPQHKLIIDCDPGVDDAIALLLAFASPGEIEVAGITTVAGNVALERTTQNALRVCELAGVDVPVYAGCERPLFPHPKRLPSVHGIDGLGDIGLPGARTLPQDKHAVDFIIDTVLQFPGEITLCPIGPMTNIALAMRKVPRIAELIKNIIFMGGAAFCPGNTSPMAEFNIWFDPHAAEIVLSSGAELTMFGLDVTNKALITKERLERVKALPSQAAKSAVAMMEAYGSGDSALHDPCVIAHILDKTLFSGVDAKVEVDCVSSLSRGKTVAVMKERHLLGEDTNCRVMTDVDNDRLFDLVTERMKRYPLGN